MWGLGLVRFLSQINGKAAVKEAGADGHHDVPFDCLVSTPISLGVNRYLMLCW